MNDLNSIHFKAGYAAAKRGDWRATPRNLKILSTAWRDWRDGFDAATEAGENPKLDEGFSLREPSPERLVGVVE